MKNILCVGISVVDVVVRGNVSSLPEKGKLKLVNSIKLYTGGCAVNTAIDLAKIEEKAGVVTLVGNDDLGEYLISELKKYNVDTRGVKRSNTTATSASVVLSSEDGERSFIHSIGTNGEFTINDIDKELVKQSDIIFVAGALLLPKFDGEQTRDFLKFAKSNGKYTIMDTAWDSMNRWEKCIDMCLPYLDTFIPSYEEACKLTKKEKVEDIANYFLERGVKNAVIKLGSDGSYLKNATEEFYTPIYKVNAIDTNGAGDSFVAGFLTGISNDWNMKETIQFATAVGAHCVLEVGTSTGIKSKKEILNFIEKERKR